MDAGHAGMKSMQPTGPLPITPSLGRWWLGSIQLVAGRSSCHPHRLITFYVPARHVQPLWLGSIQLSRCHMMPCFQLHANAWSTQGHAAASRTSSASGNRTSWLGCQDSEMPQRRRTRARWNVEPRARPQSGCTASYLHPSAAAPNCCHRRRAPPQC